MTPVFVALAVIIAASLKMASAWERFVILRAGKLQGVRGPGLFLIIPIIDSVAAVIDERIQTTAFNAEQALTKDTVPVNVDAIIFWQVHDARDGRAGDHRLPAGDRPGGADLAARDDRLVDAGRPAVGPQDGDELLREEIGAQDRRLGRHRGISVEIRDVAIPAALQDAMCRQAQAERERQARVILGSAEAEVAGQVRRGGRDLRASTPRRCSCAP